jgi:hypothetical protein
MHDIEPHYNWRTYYTAENDNLSPFHNKEYSELYFTDKIYNHLIHPQWDNIGSPTLFVKLLFTNYDENFCIIELFGEWNDCINNDIMTFKREFIDHLIENGINKFILITENVLNFHASDDCYYEEWFEDIEDGWIALLNARDHVLTEFEQTNIDYYFVMRGMLNDVSWRTYTPQDLFIKTEQLVTKRLEI